MTGGWDIQLLPKYQIWLANFSQKFICFVVLPMSLLDEGYSMGGSVKSRASGVFFALSAGILWGFVPLYIHFLGDVNPLEIVAHRSLWSLVLLSSLVAWRQHFNAALQIFCNKKLLASFTITTCFLSANIFRSFLTTFLFYIFIFSCLGYCAGVMVFCDIFMFRVCLDPCRF